MIVCMCVSGYSINYDIVHLASLEGSIHRLGGTVLSTTYVAKSCRAIHEHTSRAFWCICWICGLFAPPDLGPAAPSNVQQQ